MEVLGGEVDLDVDGFEMVLEPEFTLVVLVKVMGLGGAEALSEPIDPNSSIDSNSHSSVRVAEWLRAHIES